MKIRAGGNLYTWGTSYHSKTLRKSCVHVFHENGVHKSKSGCRVISDTFILRARIICVSHQKDIRAYCIILVTNNLLIT